MTFNLAAIVYHTTVRPPTVVEIVGLIAFAILIKLIFVTGRASSFITTYIQRKYKVRFDRVSVTSAMRLIALAIVMHIVINIWTINQGIVAVYPSILFSTVLIWLIANYPPTVYYLRSYYWDKKIAIKAHGPHDFLFSGEHRPMYWGEKSLLLTVAVYQYWTGRWTFKDYYDNWRKRIDQMPPDYDTPVYLLRITNTVEALKQNRVLKGGMILDNTTFNLYFENSKISRFLRSSSLAYSFIVLTVWLTVMCFSLILVANLDVINPLPHQSFWAFLLLASFYYATATLMIYVGHMTSGILDTDPPFSIQYLQHIKRKQYRVQYAPNARLLNEQYLKRFHNYHRMGLRPTIMCVAIKDHLGRYYWADLGARHYNLVSYAVNMTGVLEGYTAGYLTSDGRWISSHQVKDYLGPAYPWLKLASRDQVVLTENLC